jgi:hypothetical protein
MYCCARVTLFKFLVLRLEGDDASNALVLPSAKKKKKAEQAPPPEPVISKALAKKLKKIAVRFDTLREVAFA